MRQRILLLFEYATLNGGERSMLAVIDAADRERFEFAALAPPVGPLIDELQARSIVHVPIGFRDEGGERCPREVSLARIASAIRQIRPDVLHANSLAMGRLSGAVAGRLPVPCVAHLRDILRLSRAAIDGLNGNQQLVAVSEATRQYHVDQALDRGRVRVVYNGVDCDRFRPRPATGTLRKQLGIAEDAFVMLSVGQIGLRKGQDVLAQAAVALGSRRPPLHFVIVGERNSSKHESIQFERRLTAHFESADLQNRLHLLGYRGDVPALMTEADLLVHTAHQEPFGRVLLEAAASGLPVVATRAGGTLEMLRDDVDARLIPPGDPARLASAIIELATCPVTRQRFAESARRRIARCFTQRQSADRLADLWHDTIGERLQ